MQDMDEYRRKLRRMCHKRFKRRRRVERRKELSLRMKENNPMFDPEVVKKVSEKLKGNQNARKVKK